MKIVIYKMSRKIGKEIRNKKIIMRIENKINANDLFFFLREVSPRLLTFIVDFVISTFEISTRHLKIKTWHKTYALSFFVFFSNFFDF